ncbi:hypothetical protein ZYGR_0AD00390 [Zygosaccharomyces rouxii]|uniref:ZYRO0G06820p n=2 Tax=Zygosaccharomyces rouxii TaxID=4956 RepID=C5DZS5_ZYGRC|nr:uncharacterized protein ZYRO0G06820g [Zygosaccharomyces rouxii]KAH9202357.1 hypothetical protein LQ764DRAFT_20528 [Zygosaccharomyces rouxii]GAV50856.1 hypothetical protein ZYGR_0AD00390 [Zygosaccharomyces rouxii]CAR29359.1 ZYRO0G06820p [Zygosaccharomyces rouxii]
MEFFYEEQALANDPHKTEDHDEKTEKVFNKLEDEVSKRYDETAKAFKGFVAEAEDGVKLNLPLDPAVSEKTQRYLGQLDSNLQNVEKFAQGYWTKVSNPGFWSNVTNNLGNKFEQIVQLGEERGEDMDKGTDKESSKTVVGGNRTETELKTLSTDESLYLNNKLSLPEDFDADSKTQEISQILEKDMDLANLMNGIVPQEISYKDFWNIYFTQKQRILEMETTRRKILESKETNKEEEIAWDEEEDDNDKQDEEPVIIKKEDTADNDNIKKEKQTSNEESKTGKVGANANENDDDDDDDWE